MSEAFFEPVPFGKPKQLLFFLFSQPKQGCINHDFISGCPLLSHEEKHSLGIISGWTCRGWRRREEGHPRCHSACSPTTWAQGSFHYHRLHIEHVNPSPQGLEAEPKCGRSLKRCVQVLGEGAESQVCSIIFHWLNKCCLMTVFMCATKCQK